MQNLKRNVIKPRIRNLVRRILGQIALLTIRKHKPLVIGIAGNGPTSLVREAIFYVVKESTPARRNIELPEAEFSIPLTVLGYNNYPSSYLQWIWLLIKSYVQLFTVPALHHALVLELKAYRPETMYYWLNILKPVILIQIGESTHTFDHKDFKLFRSYLDADDSTTAYEAIATDVGKYLSTDQLDIELGLASMQLPEARIRILPGTNYALIVDATHYYFPLKLQSVVETTDTQTENLIAFTPYQLDQDFLTQRGWQVNPKQYSPAKGDTILLRGRRSDLLNNYRHLISQLQN